MKNSSKTGLIKASIKRLFVHKKPLATYERHPDDYWKHIYINKGHDEALDYLSKERRMSKKRFTDEIIALGLSTYISTKLQQANARAVADREAEREHKADHFVMMLRRWARDQGGDISQFIK